MTGILSRVLGFVISSALLIAGFVLVIWALNHGNQIGDFIGWFINGVKGLVNGIISGFSRL
jgi:EamA domain-containing membrane protein RarD